MVNISTCFYLKFEYDSATETIRIKQRSETWVTKDILSLIQERNIVYKNGAKEQKMRSSIKDTEY